MRKRLDNTHLLATARSLSYTSSLYGSLGAEMPIANFATACT